MKYNRYIKDTALVSEIGLGAWQLGNNSGWKSMSEKEAVELVKKSLEYGINFFDTALNVCFDTKLLSFMKFCLSSDFNPSKSESINSNSGSSHSIINLYIS